jgi:lipopolysaccharide export system permease protein
MISYALPFGFVTATLITIGELSADREWIALRSSGISPLRIFSSILFVGSCGVLLSLVVNFHYAPLAISRVKGKLQNIIREEPLRFLTPRKFIRDFPGYIIFVRSLDRGYLDDFHIWELDENEKVSTYVHSKRGNLDYDEKKQALILTLWDGVAEAALVEGKGTSFVSFERFALDLPLKDIFRGVQTQKKLRHMTLGEMLRLRDESKNTGDMKRWMEVQVGIQMQCAMAFAVLALSMVTLPLAIRLRQRGAFLNLFLALLICITYYFVMMVLSFMSGYPRLRPDLMLWIPNVVLQIYGIFRLHRINCYG